MKATHQQIGSLAKNTGARCVATCAVLALAFAAVAVPGGATVRASAARGAAHQSSTSCPIPGQCAVNPKTGCPVLGPLQPSPGQRCVKLGSRVFWVSANVNGGCAAELVVRIRVPAGMTEFEAVVYSNIGLGTRWWSDPDRNGNGPGWGPGQAVSAYGAVSYTVPSGFHAWQVGGGSSGSACGPQIMQRDWLGKGAWAMITPAVAGSGTISIHGPTNNAYQVHFNETITGTASGGANYVISGEQTSQLGGCASTYLEEFGKSDWVRWPTGTGAVHGHFTLVAKFYAQNHNKHAICSYLTNKTTKQTYAYASHFWSNS